jgi:hypothetical protein
VQLSLHRVKVRRAQIAEELVRLEANEVAARKVIAERQEQLAALVPQKE